MVDCIILTYSPDEKLLENISMLRKQTIKPSNIFIINTDEFRFNVDLDLDDSDEVKLTLVNIKKEDFDHGKTRNMASKLSNEKYILFMTQDAIAVNEKLVENLINGFEQYENVAVVYGRQVPRKGDLIEEFTRKFNYPTYDILKNKDTKSKYGIKNIFLSNVCALYDKNIFDKLSGFEENINFNEDTLYAHKAIENGYSILYKADAVVYHTHDYSPRKQYERNYQIGISHKTNKEVFGEYKTVSEGKTLVVQTAKYIISSDRSIIEKIKQLFKLVNISMAKYMGFRAGYKSVK